MMLLGIIATIHISVILEVDKIAIPIRSFFGIKHDTNGWPQSQTELEGVKGFIGNLLWCFKCITVWVGCFLAFLWYFDEKLYKYVATGFTFSWLAWVLNPILEKKRQQLS